MNIIEIKNLHKFYLTTKGEVVHALNDVNLEIKDGEFVSVVGPSGCGKTTLMMILGGLLRKTKGEVLLRNTPVDGPRRDVGVVFQNSVLLPWRTVLENTMLTDDDRRLLSRLEQELKQQRSVTVEATNG